MDAIDSATNTGSAHSETYNGGVEVEGGMAKLMHHARRHWGCADESARSDVGLDRASGCGRCALSPWGRGAERVGVCVAHPRRATFGRTSGMMTGFGNIWARGAVAQAPYQQPEQYSAGDRSGRGMQAGTFGTSRRRVSPRRRENRARLWDLRRTGPHTLAGGELCREFGEHSNLAEAR